MYNNQPDLLIKNVLRVNHGPWKELITNAVDWENTRNYGDNNIKNKTKNRWNSPATFVIYACMYIGKIVIITPIEK